MITKTQIEDAIAKWVEDQGFSPFIADQNAPQPKGLFCEIRVQNASSVGWDERRGPDGNGVATIVGNREIMVYLQTIRAGAFDALITLKDSLNKESVAGALARECLIFVEAESVVNLTDVEQTTMVERAALDIRFRTVAETSDNVGLIERVEIEGTVKSGSGTEIVTQINVGEAYTPPGP